MPMYFCPLYSGSSGNALFVQYGRTRILVDAGKSGKAIMDALKLIGVAPESLDALLITHEHSDHIAGAGVLCRRLGIPVYATEGTWQGMARKVGEIPSHLRMVFERDEDFYLGDIGVVPFAIPHDAADPVGFRLWGGDLSVATATDLGYFSPRVREALAGSSLVLLESNHDPDLLRANPHYSQALKQRILGRRGHLSNAAAAGAAMELLEDGTHHLILGHLSGENNTPELALSVTRERAMDEGVSLGDELTLEVALRDRVSALYTVGENTAPIGG